MSSLIKMDPRWEKFLSREMDIDRFYSSLERFLKSYPQIIPREDKIFHIFDYMGPRKVKAVLFGEDPYPRLSSACGVAFWDREIVNWNEKTRGSSPKNILKALIILKKSGTYNTSIAECREIVTKRKLKQPPELFRFWLNQGILLINTSMTFSSPGAKKEHFTFWKPFHQALIKRLNSRKNSPYYILWGGKAQKWKQIIEETIDKKNKIICQGHPTFGHQFMDKNNPCYSPFHELEEKTGLSWI